MRNCKGRPRQIEDFIHTPWIVSACSDNDTWQFIAAKWVNCSKINDDGSIEAFETKKDAINWVRQHLNDKYRFPKETTILEFCKIAPYIQDRKCIYEVITFESVKVEYLERWLKCSNNDIEDHIIYTR